MGKYPTGIHISLQEVLKETLPPRTILNVRPRRGSIICFLKRGRGGGGGGKIDDKF